MSELPPGHDRSVPRSSSPATGERDSAAAGSARESGSVPRVGVLSLHNSKETKAICNAIEALGCDPVWIREENVTSRIEDGRVRVTPAVDVLLNRLLVTKSERPLEDVQLASLYAESVPVLNHPRAVQRTIHKYRSAVRLAAEGIPVPDAYFARSPRRFEEWTEHLPARAAHKRTIGTNGREMSIATPGEPVSPRITDEQSFLQEFVDTGSDPPFDLRVYVVGGDVVGAMRRHAPEGEWRTNVALGGDVEAVTGDLDPTAAEIATVVGKTDTGARRTSVDAALAGEVGAGPLVGTTDVRSGTRMGVETRPLVEVDVRVAGGWRTVTASVTDRSDLQYPVLLGRDVLQGFTLDISDRVEE